MTDVFNGTVTLASLMHFGFSLIAILSGIGVFCFEKGTARHKALGRIYVPSMMVVCLAVFGIYDLTGGPNLNHLLSTMTMILVIAAFACVRFKRPQRRWAKYHSLALLWSYVTLLAFGSSQLASHVPAISERVPTLLVPLVVVFVGGFLIRLAPSLSQT